MQENKRLLQAIMRNNLTIFTAKSFSTVSPGGQYLHNWHVEAICSKLMQVINGDITRLIINIPPRYLKSICVSVAWPAWMLGHDPSKKIIASSYSQALSNKHSQDCRVLMTSDWYQELFPWLKISKGENQKSKFVTTDRGFRFATSTGGTVTGEGGDILIVDDPQNPNKINSKKYRENTIEWFEQTFISRLNNKKKGAIVIVMQRLHEDDLCGYLLKNKPKQWELLKIPAITDEEWQIALHPEREDIESLKKLQTELGEYNFAAQYLQEPVPSKGTMIQKTWLKYFIKEEKIEFSQIIQSWDTAIKAKDENDYSVGITIGVNNEHFYILDICRAKVEFPDLLALVQDFAKKWKPRAILVEDKASGQSLIQSLAIRIPIIAIKPKFDKITRFASHSPFFESGKIFIAEDANWRINFEKEILSFPKSTNDDQVDALSQALTYLQQNKPIQLRSL
ncbi:MAG: phage terminase large subunit [Pseudomonadota bacterium]